MEISMLKSKSKLAERLKALRKHFDKSQKEMAEWVGITQLAWFNYESGKSLPNGKVLAKLCEYGVNINWVLAKQGDMLSYLNFAPENKIDAETNVLLTEAIQHVETWLNSHEKTIPANKKAELLTHIYADTLETGESEINSQRADSLLKLVTG
jgi:transcriptional regulator with XRE-family HTH domain